MKKVRIGIAACLFFWLAVLAFACTASAAQEDDPLTERLLSELPLSGAEGDDSLTEGLLSELPLSGVEEALSGVDGGENLSFTELLRQLLNQEETDKKELLRRIVSLFFADMEEYRDFFIQIIAVAAAFAFLYNFMNVFESGQISRTGFYLYFLVMMVLLMRSYLLLHDLIGRLLAQMVEFMQALLPAFCMAMVFSSQQTTAVAFYQLSLIVIYLVERIILYLIVPAVHVYVVLQMLNFMTDEKLISRITALIRSAVRWGLRMLLAGVTGMNIIENMIAPSVDNLKKMSVTKTISMIPGLGNTAEAVGNIFLGSAVVIKNGIGAAALVALVVICAGPFFKMLLFALFYRIAGAIVQPFADKRICGCIDSVGDGAFLLLRTLVTAMLLFMITVAVVVTAAR